MFFTVNRQFKAQVQSGFMLSTSKCKDSLSPAVTIVSCYRRTYFGRLALYESPNSLLKRKNPEGFFGTHIWPCIIDGIFLDMPDIILERYSTSSFYFPMHLPH